MPRPCSAVAGATSTPTAMPASATSTPATASGPPRLMEVGCWAHARQKIYEVHVATGSPAAKEILDRIAALFEIEADIRGRDPDARLAARQQRTVPLLAELRAFLDETLDKSAARVSLAQAIRYARSRWDALCRFIDRRPS